jgi:polysaccharide biosynthesis/export protein
MLNNMMKLRIKIIFIFSAIILTSCASKSKMVYLINNQESTSESVFKEVLIEPDDILQIVVTSDNPEVSEPFNIPRFSLSTNSVSGSTNNNNLLLTYLVDANGYVQMPKIGNVKVSGLTRTQAIEHLTNILTDYIKNPMVSLRIANFKYAVLGEVSKPGTFTIESERVTIFDAIANAGDLTVYGERQNIKIVREIEGKKEIAIVNITDTDIINSPYYYLKQNDVVYVEPNQIKLNSSKFGPSVSITISIISLAVSAILIFTR